MRRLAYDRRYLARPARSLFGGLVDVAAYRHRSAWKLLGFQRVRAGS